MKKIAIISAAALIMAGLWLIFTNKNSSLNDFGEKAIQTEEENEAISSFQLDKPEGWYEQSGATLGENLSRFEFTDAELAVMLKNDNDTVPVAIYTKYDPSEVTGMIPTIQVTLRPNRTKDFAEFKELMEQSADSMKNFFDNFEFIDKQQETEIAGIQSIYFKAEFDLPTADGDLVHVRSWTYAIPVDSYFYQINFSDDAENDDCSDIFQEAIDSVVVVAE